MVTERTLRRWRRDALLIIDKLDHMPKEGITTDTFLLKEVNLRILRLTQTLLDQRLIQKR